MPVQIRNSTGILLPKYFYYPLQQQFAFHIGQIQIGQEYIDPLFAPKIGRGKKVYKIRELEIY
jgi:hypothetical protein